MPRILVVDDDAVDRELAERCLKVLADADLVLVEDATQALRAFEESPADLVLTDLRMPGMSGFELVEVLSERSPLTPVVLMTSQGNESVAVQALQAGASSYVPKQDMEEILAETVQQMLELGEARRSRQQVMGFLRSSEDRFDLPSDTSLISSIVGYLQENLQLLGFADEATRGQIGIALSEAISNAIIHGNLEVDSRLRQDDREAYHRLLRERSERSPWKDRRVRLIARESPTRVEYVIEDEGSGFDPDALPDPTSPENMLQLSGRGVWLIRNFMDEVEFNEKGNRLSMVKSLP